MNAKQFLTLMSKGNSLQDEDFRELLRLHETFPYFSIPKVLAAKYSLARQKEGATELLHWASVVSPDRVHLRQLIESDIDFLPLPNGTDKAPVTEHPGAPEKNEEKAPPLQENPESFNRQEILRKLEENLNRFKHPPKKGEPGSPEDGAKSFEESTGKTKEDDLIEAIKKKEKKEILDSRKKKQNELIKAFSKKSGRLTVSRENESSDQTDLSRESTKFNDNLVSESFAKLLVEQDKKEKAIEIYKKLILKFPEKTAYFTGLIKALEE